MHRIGAIIGDVIQDRRTWGAAAVLAAAAIGWAAVQPSKAELTAEGRELFVHEWTVNDPLSVGGDGLGPVFNATSCVACHFQGGVGGAGPNDRNVQAFETRPTSNDPVVHGGVVHAAAVEGVTRETAAEVNQRYPVIPGGRRIVANCAVNVADFDPVIFHEINTPALFGAGEIDRISGWTIRGQKLWRQAGSISQELKGEFKSTPTGRVRVLPDGRVGKFGWKAQFATLDEFVATACAVELGLSNSVRRQDRPHTQSPDSDAALDMTSRQLKGLVMFSRTLAAPRRDLPADAMALALVEQGEKLFLSIGCADCHTPDLGGVRGVYSDFCLHSIAAPDPEGGYSGPAQVPLPADIPAPDEWKTPPLWGCADTAPYMHDGSARTLEEAIQAHDGAARHVRQRYREKLTDAERQAVLAFLSSLKAPVE